MYGPAAREIAGADPTDDEFFTGVKADKGGGGGRDSRAAGGRDSRAAGEKGGGGGGDGSAGGGGAGTGRVSATGAGAGASDETIKEDVEAEEEAGAYPRSR
jgi:hypothetical protein